MMIDKNIKVALVCIAKYEENYIHEWLDYHFKLGFDDIYIYENDWRIQTPKEHVNLIPFDGVGQQILAYNDFITKNKMIYDWACFIDVDEFIVLKKHNNIKDFIEDYSGYNSIAINWVLFGDNGLEKITDNNYLVVDRFTKSQLKVNKHIKTISKLSADPIYNLPHNPTMNWVDTNYNIGNGPFNETGTNDVAQINHYFCKTTDEFIKKIKRGRTGTSNGQKRSMSDFDAHNINEITDLSALEFKYK